MRAVVYQGPRDVGVSKVPDAEIEKPTDVVVRLTTTNICGSDLHMYQGRTSFEPGQVFGHENLGEVIEVGSGVDRVKKGDRVCLPFNIGCGFCENCERGLTGFCSDLQSRDRRCCLWFRRDGSRIQAARRTCSACHTPTSTPWSFRRTRRRRKTTT